MNQKFIQIEIKKIISAKFNKKFLNELTVTGFARAGFFASILPSFERALTIRGGRTIVGVAIKIRDKTT